MLRDLSNLEYVILFELGRVGPHSFPDFMTYIDEALGGTTFDYTRSGMRQAFREMESKGYIAETEGEYEVTPTGEAAFGTLWGRQEIEPSGDWSGIDVKGG